MNSSRSSKLVLQVMQIFGFNKKKHYGAIINDKVYENFLY
jgi:hypothetical protein